jgi:hypothetical protein
MMGLPRFDKRGYEAGGFRVLTNAATNDGVLPRFDKRGYEAGRWRKAVNSNIEH